MADFGISRVMNSPGSKIQTDVGTPPYMSPEKIREEDYGLGSDIWYFKSLFFIIKLFGVYLRSLGIILYEMCMNKLQFRGDEEIKSKPTPEFSKEFEDMNQLFKE